MDLVELKKRILNKERVSLPIIFINKNDDEFLVKSYIKEIANNSFLEVKEVNNFQEIEDIENDVFSENNYLFIYRLGKDDTFDAEYVIGKKIIFLTSEKIETDINQVEFSKVLPWQIEEYVKVLLPGLDTNEIVWLCKVCKYDILRINSEADKLKIFEKKKQKEIFQLINKDNGYCDLNELTIFNLTNAIMKKDILTIKNVIKDLDNIDVEGTGLVTLLLRHFKNVIDIQLNPKATASALGMSDKQFNAIKYYNCNKYSNDKLIEIYQFLTDIDYKLKSGLLEMTNKEMSGYILSHILK